MTRSADVLPRPPLIAQVPNRQRWEAFSSLALDEVARAVRGRMMRGTERFVRNEIPRSHKTIQTGTSDCIISCEGLQNKRCVRTFHAQ